MPKRIAAWFAAALAALMILPHAAARAQSYPSKPIKLVLPFGPGSATDTVSRIIAQDLSIRIGQQFVPIHKPGADGSLAAIEVKRSAADGYTLLFGTNSPFSVVPNLRKEAPYDTLADFTPITYLGDTPFVIVANPSVPAKSLAELIAYAKANPRKLNYASGNTFAIVATAMFAANAGIEMQHIPYKSEPEAIPDLLSGQVQLMFGTPTTTIPHVRAGKLTVLAQIFDTRSPLLPDVPTTIELGQPKLPIRPWFALAGPAGMPAETVDYLNKEFAVTLAKPEIQEQLAKFGFTPRPGTPQALGAFFKDQLAVWKSALAAAGIEPQ
jgi:tripartite-type tricarboxylate transporter receptor subunit TctC